MIPELNDTVMFIRDVVVEDQHGNALDQLCIGERGRVIHVEHSTSGDKYGIHLFKKNKNVYYIKPKEILVLEDDSPEKVVLT